MLHLITCHGHIMPRLAELLFRYLGIFPSKFNELGKILLLVFELSNFTP